MLLLPHVHPSVVALAHLWLPGFLLSVCMGAVYQLAPVGLGVPLRLPLAVAWSHLGLHATGVAVLVAGFVLGRFALVGIGGTAVAVGVLGFAVGVARTFGASTRRDAIGWSFPLSAGWLALTVLVGVLLTCNRRTPFLPLSIVDLLRSHAHLGLAGFFLTLLQGATFQLVPMFTMAELQRPRFVTAGVILAQSGLLALAPALALGARGATVAGALLLAGGIGASAVAFVATLRNRRRRVLEPGVKAFALGAALLAAGAAGGLALVLTRAGEAAPAAVAYGVVVVAGALSFMVLGMLCKIVPFLVWMKTYGPRAGRQRVPLATALGSKPLELGWLVAHGAAVLLLLAGLAAGSPSIVGAAAVLLFAAVLTFLTNIVRIVRHLVQPLTLPAPAPRAAPVVT
jgi:hypothetical protein